MVKRAGVVGVVILWITVSILVLARSRDSDSLLVIREIRGDKRSEVYLARKNHPYQHLLVDEVATASLSPNRRWLIYQTSHTQTLNRFDFQTGTTLPLPYHDFWAWSSQEEWVLLRDRGGIFHLFNLLTFDEAALRFFDLNLHFRAWSDDGEWIIFQRLGPDRISDRVYRYHIPSRRVYENEGHWGGFSATAQRIILYRDGQIEQVSLDGSQPTQLTNHTGFYEVLAWSADDEWIYYVEDLRGLAQIERTRRDGTDREPLLTIEEFDQQEAISPDGQWMIYYQKDDIGIHLNALHLPTLTTYSLLDSRGYPQVLGWSPDSQWLIIEESDFFYRMHPDGTASLLLNRGKNYFSHLLTWSAEGQEVLFATNLFFDDLGYNNIISIRLEDGRVTPLTRNPNAAKRLVYLGEVPFESKTWHPWLWVAISVTLIVGIAWTKYGHSEP